MSDEVQLFYAELTSASSVMQTAGTDAIEVYPDLSSGDPGVGNPAQRASLRLEFHRRTSALRENTQSLAIGASSIGADVQRIADRYSELDRELNGGTR